MNVVKPTEKVLVLIGLGSNIEPERHLALAWRLLNERLGVLATSAIYRSRAVDSPGAPDFENAAVLVATDLPPLALKLEVLRRIEAELGRQRTAVKSAPRTLDLDLVLYGSWVLDDPATGLHLPHPDLTAMPYVARPAADVAPELLHPVTAEPLEAIARRLEASDVLPLLKLERRLEPPFEVHSNHG